MFGIPLPWRTQPNWTESDSCESRFFIDYSGGGVGDQRWLGEIDRRALLSPQAAKDGGGVDEAQRLTAVHRIKM